MKTFAQILRARALRRAAVAGVLLGLAALPAQAVQQKFCVKTRVTTVDSGIGEDYYTAPGGTTHPARYTRMRVSRAGFLITDTYADASGCVTFDWPFTDNFKLEMWSEARVPRTDNPGHTNTLKILDSDLDQGYWVWFLTPSSYPAYLYTNQSNLSNLLGISSWILARWSDGLVGKTIQVIDAACPSIPDNSCNTGADVYINPASNNRKFLIGHELGHALVFHWYGTGYHPAASYTTNSGGVDCETPAGMHHAMHSKERQSAAMLEGFAQFYSAAVWNSEGSTGGKFHYYKTNYKNGAVTTIDVEYPVDAGLNPLSYLENRCSGTLQGYGVEMDWMRAFWDYRTDSGTAPSHYQLLRQIKNAVTGGNWSHATAYTAFADAVTDYDVDYGTSFSPRWTADADWNGVDH